MPKVDCSSLPFSDAYGLPNCPARECVALGAPSFVPRNSCTAEASARCRHLGTIRRHPGPPAAHGTDGRSRPHGTAIAVTIQRSGVAERAARRLVRSLHARRTALGALGSSERVSAAQARSSTPRACSRSRRLPPGQDSDGDQPRKRPRSRPCLNAYCPRTLFTRVCFQRAAPSRVSFIAAAASVAGAFRRG